MEILRGVIKKSLIIILPAAAASAFVEWKRLPLGIMIGWLFGVVNLRALIKNVEGVVGSRKATAKMIFLSITRLFMLFTAIFIIVWLKIINVFGMLLGFTVVFVLILFEGMKIGKRG